MYCPNCGEPTEGDGRCGSCREAIPDPPTAETVDTDGCSSCGAVINRHVAFCRHCGADLSERGAESSIELVATALARSTRRELLDVGSLLLGAVFGVLAYGLGYAAVYGVELIRGGSSGFAPWRHAGYLFYNAHRVPLRQGAKSGYLSGADLHTFVVPVVLMLVGATSAYLLREREWTVPSNAAGLIVSYYALAIAGVFAFATTTTTITGATTSIRPLLGQAQLFGLAFPLIYVNLGNVVMSFNELTRLKRAFAPVVGVLAGVLAIIFPPATGLLQIGTGYYHYRRRNKYDGIAIVILGVVVAALGFYVAAGHQ